MSLSSKKVHAVRVQMSAATACTAKSAKAKRITKRNGAWFDAYEDT